MHENNTKKCALLFSAFPWRWMTYSLDCWRHPHCLEKKWELLQQKCKKKKIKLRFLFFLFFIFINFHNRLLDSIAEISFERQNFWVRRDSLRKERLWESQSQPSSVQNLKIMLAYHAGKGSKNIQMILLPGAWNEDHWDLERS